LYLLKTKKAKTVTEAAEMLGRNRVTVQDWLGKYRQGGLEKLLSKKVSDRSQVQNCTQISILSAKSVSKNSQTKKPRTIRRKVRGFKKKTS